MVPMNEGSPTSKAPQARRFTHVRWKDPRLLIGLLLVAASVVAGARILAAGDETSAVWALRADVRAGAAVASDDLERVRVHLDEDTKRHYVAAEGPDSDTFVGGRQQRVWTHDVRAGELVSRSALSEAEEAAGAELPLRVETGSLPGDLGAGDRVDVWVSQEVQASSRPGVEDPAAARAIASARVINVRATNAALSDGGTQVVLVAVDRDQREQLDEVLATLVAGKITLIRVRDPGSS